MQTCRFLLAGSWKLWLEPGALVQIVLEAWLMGLHLFFRGANGRDYGDWLEPGALRLLLNEFKLMDQITASDRSREVHTTGCGHADDWRPFDGRLGALKGMGTAKPAAFQFLNHTSLQAARNSSSSLYPAHILKRRNSSKFVDRALQIILPGMAQGTANAGGNGGQATDHRSTNEGFRVGGEPADGDSEEHSVCNDPPRASSSHAPEDKSPFESPERRSRIPTKIPLP
ncbi:hypothetical protein B0H13DRAFT_1887212 [Mycena leptocephala]|nr:hypothetical protein B0H13DRAFT_1887212 [Mycena leptocephala]